FALHPLHVESVAWITERKDVLSTFFGLVTVWAYLGYVQHPSWLRYLGVMLAMTLGLMAKPMLVTLPCVLLLLDYWPLRRWPQRSTNPPELPEGNAAGPSLSTRSLPALIWEKLPLFFLAAFFGGLTIYAQHQVGALMPLERFPVPVRCGT